LTTDTGRVAGGVMSMAYGFWWQLERWHQWATVKYPVLPV
jgi:hypothetical protein